MEFRDEFKVPDGIFYACEKFAQDCYSTNKEEYARRGQRNEEACKNQIMQGKIAEFAVESYLNASGFSSNSPDLSIYQADKKHFGADLRAQMGYTQYFIHVKSISESSVEKYGESYLFQVNDPLICTPRYEDYIAFCLVSDNFKNVKIRNILPSKDIIEGKNKKYYIDYPKLEKLRDNKRAIYLRKD